MRDILAIIDYGSGNLRSAAKSFEKIIAENAMNMDVLITDKAEDIAKASHIVLPGQGAYGDCMSGLKNVDGMIEALEESVLKRGAPFLGICVGMQLLTDKGFEYGEHDGLGWIAGEVHKMQPSDKALKIPHMGWNEVEWSGSDYSFLKQKSPCEEDHFYFVHSYHAKMKDDAHVLATTQYGGKITAIIGKDNIIGTQFHPEKSQKAGLSLLKDFVNWKP